MLLLWNSITVLCYVVFAADIVSGRTLLRGNSSSINDRFEDSDDPVVQNFFRQRRQLVENLHHEHDAYNNGWTDIREVDGLKNEDVAVFITSTSMKGEIYLWER
jgi:hypothetical protein